MLTPQYLDEEKLITRYEDLKKFVYNNSESEQKSLNSLSADMKIEIESAYTELKEIDTKLRLLINFPLSRKKAEYVILQVNEIINKLTKSPSSTEIVSEDQGTMLGGFIFHMISKTIYKSFLNAGLIEIPSYSYIDVRDSTLDYEALIISLKNFKDILKNKISEEYNYIELEKIVYTYSCELNAIAYQKSNKSM